MSVGLGSNILSLTTQRHLAQAQRQGAVATERLSSGLRINSSGDDAAGIAVAARLGVRASGLGIGLRNVNEAVSLLQVTETAIDDASRGLMRLRELALQSANGSNGPGDRNALQQEAAQILEEIRRLASQTSYRVERLLDGRTGALGFQLGSAAGEQFQLEDMPNLTAEALGSATLVLDGSSMGRAQAPAPDTPAYEIGPEPDLELSTFEGGSTGQINVDNGMPNFSARYIAQRINLFVGDTGIEASASTRATLSHLSAAGTVSFTLGLSPAVNPAFQEAAISVGITDSRDLSPLLAAINAANIGYAASFVNNGDRSAIRIEHSTGQVVRIADFAGSAGGNQTIRFAGERGPAVTLEENGNDSSVVHGLVTLTSSKGPITARNANTDMFGGTTSSLTGVSLATAAQAGRALEIVDGALGQLNDYRSRVGAWLNRLESTASNLTTGASNLGAARGRIVDADFAIETANLVRNQVLQQAGAAMVAQANLQPREVLSLLLR
jgi:flagellin